MDKCMVLNGITKPCAGLEKLIDAAPFNKRKRGVTEFVALDSKSGDVSKIWIGLNRTDNYQNGIVFNYCPMCGAEIIPNDKQE